jgi:hypothetical protein
MVIRIVHNGNPATKIIPSFDECVIESLVDDQTGEGKNSFVMDLKNGNPIFKRIRDDADVEEYIANLYEHEEIASITQDNNRDFIITLRELGEEPLDAGEVSDNPE